MVFRFDGSDGDGCGDEQAGRGRSEKVPKTPQDHKKNRLPQNNMGRIL